MSQAKKTDDENFKLPDPVAFGHALVSAYEKAQPLFEEYVKKYSDVDVGSNFTPVNIDPLNVREAYMDFLDSIAKDPSKFMEKQAAFAKEWMGLWQNSMSNFMGGDGHNNSETVEPKFGDRRFKAQEWQESALFNYIKQSYLLTCKHMEKTISDADGLTDKQREKLAFQTRLFTDALSPTNFLMTNPEVIKETMKTGGENLVKGFQNLLEDLERGQGELSISTTDYKAFELGRNIAVTPGRVVFQNDLMQLIQYSPQTKKVHKTPLLIVPPWINKYYILDLRPDNSLVEWAVAQGHSVFIISWINPSIDLAQKEFEDYMSDGVLAALGQIEKITGEDKTNVTGYCLGGTLLATTLSYLTDKKQSYRIASATFLTTLLDFEHAGDMKVFLDDEQLESLDKEMLEKGVLRGKELQRTFSLMRANDLIWSFVINNYLMGREPFPFDLLYWNDDCTNMPAAMHRFYLRSMYRDNKLIEAGGIKIKNHLVDLSKIKTPCYFLSTKEDHIAPWKATYQGTQLMSGDTCFTLAASGHIAGVVNPPIKDKYCYWSYDKTPKDPDTWTDKAKEHKGSWWVHWNKWIEAYAGEMVLARNPDKGIEAAPGSYVKVRH